MTLSFLVVGKLFNNLGTFFISNKDALEAIAAIVVSVASIYGVTTWKKQLRGKNEYNTAKNILQKSYELQDSIRKARDTAIPSYELLNQEKQDGVGRWEKAVNGEKKLYGERLRLVEKIRNELKVMSFEGRALWGSKTLAEVDLLIQSSYLLENYYYPYYRGKLSARSNRQPANLMRKYEEVLFASEEDNDEFWKAVIARITIIEDKLGSKIRKP